MLTLFACPKPFTDPHIALIQRNAIQSWAFLEPKLQIILCGNEVGVREIASEFKLDYISALGRNEYGTPIVSDLFQKAEEKSKEHLLCYVNSDIIFTTSLIRAVKILQKIKSRFLAIGARSDLEITTPMNFASRNIDSEIEELARRKGKLMNLGSDYFIFPTRTFTSIPPFALGRTTWDNWLIWKARSQGLPVIDATEGILAGHQMHSSNENWKALVESPEAIRNMKLAGAWKQSYTVEDANYSLSNETCSTKRTKALKTRFRKTVLIVADKTRRIRTRLGLTRKTLGGSR